jgi:hypothetical protein
MYNSKSVELAKQIDMFVDILRDLASDLKRDDVLRIRLNKTFNKYAAKGNKDVACQQVIKSYCELGVHFTEDVSMISLDVCGLFQKAVKLHLQNRTVCRHDYTDAEKMYLAKRDGLIQNYSEYESLELGDKAVAHFIPFSLVFDTLGLANVRLLPASKNSNDGVSYTFGDVKSMWENCEYERLSA